MTVQTTTGPTDRTPPDPDATTVARGTEPLDSDRTPLGFAGVSVVGIALALVLLGLAVVAAHDVLAITGAVGGPRWVDSTVSSVDGVKAALWVIPVSLLLVLLGLALLVSSVRRRRRPYVALASGSGVYLRVKDTGALAEAAAGDVDGVAEVSASASRRKMRMTVTGTGEDGLQAAVREAVERALAPLASPPRVTVDVRSESKP